ncbi:hypothetical protein [Microbacterium sp. ZXX196]|uniref:hypothetical protein n=1 Tax=Microbacterium sp. ZXX196 TaxID=2609291 RepID=UPI0012B78031|nr:hypothetical protein [Microbacterium sp. ZXX196]MTE24823.1 hypothetical protein [Microbacterium sp. ZXX196]
MFLDTRGVEGMHFPTVTKHKSTSRSVPGARVRGWRTEARDVFWPIWIWGERSTEFLEKYEAFFRTIHPVNAGTWRVGFDGAFRELSLTGTFSDPHAYARDPVFDAWSSYGVTLEAAQPYWSGSPIARSWRSANPVDFFDPAGSPPFHISPSATFADAQITNPGDVEAYPRWVIEGPLDPVIVGVDGVEVLVPFPLSDGSVLVIDTDPRNVTATLNGSDVSQELGFQRFAPIPPGGSVPLSITAGGGGRVSIELVPLYFRAF